MLAALLLNCLPMTWPRSIASFHRALLMAIVIPKASKSVLSVTVELASYVVAMGRVLQALM